MCLHILLSSDLSTVNLSDIKTALNHQDTGEAGEGPYGWGPAGMYTSTANLNLHFLPFVDFCRKSTVFSWRSEAQSETCMTRRCSNQAGVCSHFPLFCVCVCHHCCLHLWYCACRNWNSSLILSQESEVVNFSCCDEACHGKSTREDQIKS